MSTVSLIRCESYEPASLEPAVEKAVGLLGGMSRFVKPGDRVLLKPNLLSARLPDKRITTDPSVVAAVAKQVMLAGGKPVIGDSPALDSFNRTAEKTGMAEVAGQLGVELVELNDPVPVSPPSDATFKRLEIATQALNADVVINLPKLKTHCKMLLTLGIKNLFGTVVAQRKAEWHHMAGVGRDTFASLLLDIYRTVNPALTILDGIWGMEGHGPANGIPRKMNLIAASRDAVALDLTVCRLLGVPLKSFPLFRAAKARKIGETNMDRVTWRGDPPESFRDPDFRIPELTSMEVVPETFHWFTKRYLVSKPLHMGNHCIGCGQCEKICPEAAIELEGKRVAIDYNQCIRCYCCQEICPEDAIHFRKGLLVRLMGWMKR